ncbi:MAG: cytochrome C oxidase subunit IV family protein [Phycisphaerae bacterium]|nr:cytochrome C oxidase subunit IV family protein [Phycisphaerae bacterium]
MSFAHPDEARKHRNAYLKVFAALAVLTVVTVAVAEMKFLSMPMAIAVAMVVAGTKASLVAAYFMHLISERKAIYATLILCGVLFVALLLLPVVTQGEVDAWRRTHVP